ncbi:uncharacterized protein LOC134851603 isoform X2 [Symsagittifera roscoffensis]|uniref:uncharacterized protein LOC134851603 isoform X2 n=1 Tax=Symsagittifera roscoffensis TaxID=84072 RepID=UPI00307BD944
MESAAVTSSNPDYEADDIIYPQWFIITYNNTIFLCLLVGFVSNFFILVNSFTDAKMRTTNYFFVMNLVVVDIFVILGILVVKEVAIAMESENFFLACFPTVWNFVVNYSASNYILLILCYEKFVMITLPFRKDKLLCMRVKVIFTLTVYSLTVAVALLKFHTMDPRGDNWCTFAYPVVSEWVSDLLDMFVFFATPILIQFLLYLYTFYSAKRLTASLNRPLQAGLLLSSSAAATNNITSSSAITHNINTVNPSSSAGYQLTLAQPNPTDANSAGGASGGCNSNNQQNQNQNQQPTPSVYRPSRPRQQPQLKIAKMCLVATAVRFLLWLPYVIHLVRLSIRQATGLAREGDRSRGEKIVDMFLPDLTIIASCTNPIVFIAMSPPLKRRLAALCGTIRQYCCCCCPVLRSCCCGESTSGVPGANDEGVAVSPISQPPSGPIYGNGAAGKLASKGQNIGDNANPRNTRGIYGRIRRQDTTSTEASRFSSDTESTFSDRSAKNMVVPNAELQTIREVSASPETIGKHRPRAETRGAGDGEIRTGVESDRQSENGESAMDKNQSKSQNGTEIRENIKAETGIPSEEQPNDDDCETEHDDNRTTYV